VPFYILGLSPNASRLSVRFWLVGTVGDFAERLARHVSNLEMDGARPDDPPLIIRRLLFETAREPKDISPQLAGAMARAVLMGGPYPQLLLNALIRRIQADRRVNHPRAAAIKAFLVRNRNWEVPVSLDPDRQDPAYRLGRLFATLEKTQEDALPGLNATIKDRYFGAASATPATVFPRLMRLHHHHMGKIDSPGLRVNREKLVQSICEGLDAFPRHLPLDEQGLFYIGYYHQRQAFFQKKVEPMPSQEITV
jgi:CRISPR-associated protein Csd1